MWKAFLIFFALVILLGALIGAWLGAPGNMMARGALIGAGLGVTAGGALVAVAASFGSLKQQ